MERDPFVVLAEPARRNIMDQLRTGGKSVNELVERLGMPQPNVSKHLRMLREAGLVSSQAAAQQRIYQIELAQIRAIDAWLEPYRKMWSRHLDALEQHLNTKED